jgi:SAM-dependent methyltransferase
MRVRDRLHPDRGYFHITRCRNCGLVFLNPRPTLTEIKNFYPSGYGSRPQDLRGRKKESLYKRIPGLLFGDPDIPERLDSDPYFTGRRGRVLDVGTGGGELLVEFHKRGWDATGLEPFCEPSPLVKDPGIEIVRTPFIDADLPPEHYNVVIMNYVFEHLHDPLDALRKASYILAPGGMVYIGVQNFDCFCRRILGPRWFPLEVPRHMNQFTPRVMAKFAQAAGLRLAKIRFEANSNCLRESLLSIFVSSKRGGEFPGSSINRILRTPVMKVVTALVSGVLAMLKQSELVGYYLIKE